MDLGLAGRTALVTGASSGIGRSCVEQLLAEGARVCGVARDVDPLAPLTEAHAGRLTTVAADLATTTGCERAASGARAALGHVDVLVSCAGAAQAAPVADVTRAQVDEAVALKLHGALRLSQLLAPDMATRGWGRIVLVAGSAGTSPTADSLPISLANIGLHTLARSLTDAFAPDGVLVNVVAPGLTRTPRAERLLAQRAALEGRRTDDVAADIARSLPAGRITEPDEVARAVCFLASKAASAVHASVLYLDGGARRATP